MATVYIGGVKPTDPFRETLGAALEHSLHFLENLRDGPVSATASLETLRGRLARELADEGATTEHVVAELVRDVEGGIVGPLVDDSSRGSR